MASVEAVVRLSRIRARRVNERISRATRVSRSWWMRRRSTTLSRRKRPVRVVWIIFERSLQ